MRKTTSILLLVALVLPMLVRPAATRGQEPAVDESFRPIVVAGAPIGALLGTAVAEIFVYAYRDGTWTQIPFQIDEKAVNEEGQRVYAATGDGTLDGDEELVFMLKDMGTRAPASAWVQEAATDQRIELEAETVGGSRHWAYLFHGPELTRTFTGDYVRFSGAAQRVIAESFEVGFLANGVGFNELRLNNSGVDILDRTKLRLEIVLRIFGVPVARRTCNEDTLTEEDGCGLQPQPIAPLKDGPVRLISGERGGFTYASLFQQRSDIDLSDLPAGFSIENLRVSWDFNEQVLATSTPTIYLDANLAEAVVIDGQPDVVPGQPVPAWRQISHVTGTAIVTTDLTTVGGTQRNYYKDDATVDSNDTGDGRSYGDAGFAVERPNSSFSLSTSLLVLPPTWENVGAVYAARLATPPALTVSLQVPAGAQDHKVYLPVIRR